MKQGPADGDHQGGLPHEAYTKAAVWPGGLQLYFGGNDPWLAAEVKAISRGPKAPQGAGKRGCARQQRQRLESTPRSHQAFSAALLPIPERV
jgi:hypothetical protein